ncbi:hypothetical protein N9N28_11620 [Rubripirellula amarantea]|nr:hypothetical protein [Rubripirellula amarantea]
MPEKIDITESAFCMFLARVRTGQFDEDDWKTFVDLDYEGYPRIQAARNQLVQTARWLGQSPSCLIPLGLPEAAQEILTSLDPNYA